jgi:hypothetical protein
MIQTLTDKQMAEILTECGRGSMLFVSYEAGRPPTERAIRESERAVKQEGMSPRHLIGTLESLWVTTKGEIVFTMLAYNRDRVVDGQLVEGGYRTINPQLGSLYSLDVIEKHEPTISCLDVGWTIS